MRTLRITGRTGAAITAAVLLAQIELGWFGWTNNLLLITALLAFAFARGAAEWTPPERTHPMTGPRLDNPGFENGTATPWSRLPTAWSRLPTARGRFNPTMYGRQPTIPARPTKHPRQKARETAAARLARPREPKLDRPQLHTSHGHRDLDLEDRIRHYVITGHDHQYEAPPLTPRERRVAQWAIDHLRTAIPDHKWGQHFRLNDIADHHQLNR